MPSIEPIVRCNSSSAFSSLDRGISKPHDSYSAATPIRPAAANIASAGIADQSSLVFAVPFASRPIGDAKADIDLYYTPAYWRGAGVQVDGIFLDEMSSDLPDVGYYQELRDYVKAKDANARVIANPGQPATQDTSGGLSGFTVMDYATAADVLVTFEGTLDDYLIDYTPAPYANALPASHFAHLIHGAPSFDDLYLTVDYARIRKVGMVYVTDDELLPNPWDTLPPYFGELQIDLPTLP